MTHVIGVMSHARPAMAEMSLLEQMLEKTPPDQKEL